MKLIDPIYFIVSFLVGLVYIHFTQAPPRVVIKYPTPVNAGKITYVDDAGVCYKYKMEKKNCPADKSKLSTVPIQQASKTEHIAATNALARMNTKKSVEISIPEQISASIMQGFTKLKSYFK
jgi:hypothetical protein